MNLTPINFIYINRIVKVLRWITSTGAGRRRSPVDRSYVADHEHAPAVARHYLSTTDEQRVSPHHLRVVPAFPPSGAPVLGVIEVLPLRRPVDGGRVINPRSLRRCSRRRVRQSAGARSPPAVAQHSAGVSGEVAAPREGADAEAGADRVVSVEEAALGGGVRQGVEEERENDEYGDGTAAQGRGKATGGNPPAHDEDPIYYTKASSRHQRRLKPF